MARAAPTCAVEGVSAGLVEDERGRHPRTRRDLDLGGFVAPHGKAVDDIIRGQTKLQQVADLRIQVVGGPAALLSRPTANLHTRHHVAR